MLEEKGLGFQRCDLRGETTDAAGILAAAKFYARASSYRAVHGIIPKHDEKADGINWQRTPQSIQGDCLGMVRAILTTSIFYAAKQTQGIIRDD